MPVGGKWASTSTCLKASRWRRRMSVGVTASAEITASPKRSTACTGPSSSFPRSASSLITQPSPTFSKMRSLTPARRRLSSTAPRSTRSAYPELYVSSLIRIGAPSEKTRGFHAAESPSLTSCGQRLKSQCDESDTQSTARSHRAMFRW
eukprot:797925-Prymnesium_polylepis.1